MLHKRNRFNHLYHFIAAQLRNLDRTGPWMFAASQILAAAPWVVAAAFIAHGCAL
jgi:hypothetical protein